MAGSQVKTSKSIRKTGISRIDITRALHSPGLSIMPIVDLTKTLIMF